MTTKSLEKPRKKASVQFVQKTEEFEAFLKVLELGKIESWEAVASALGVHRNTILKWREHPLAQKAIAKGVEHALEMMETTGKNDWKMWREKLNILGVREKNPTKLEEEDQSDKTIIFQIVKAEKI